MSRPLPSQSFQPLYPGDLAMCSFELSSHCSLSGSDNMIDNCEPRHKRTISPYSRTRSTCFRKRSAETITVTSTILPHRRFHFYVYCALLERKIFLKHTAVCRTIIDNTSIQPTCGRSGYLGNILVFLVPFPTIEQDVRQEDYNYRE